MFLEELQFRAAVRIEQEKGMYTNLRCCSRTSDLLVDSIFCVYLYELCIHFYNSQSLESEHKNVAQPPIAIFYHHRSGNSFYGKMQFLKLYFFKKLPF